MISSIKLFCVFTHLATVLTLKIAISETELLGAGMGAGEGSLFTQTQLEALEVAAEAAVAAAVEAANTELAPAVASTGVRVVQTLMKKAPAAFTAAESVISTTAAAGCPAISATVSAVTATEVVAAYAAANPGAAPVDFWTPTCSSPAATVGEGVECQMLACRAAGCEAVTIAGLTVPFGPFTVPKTNALHNAVHASNNGDFATTGLEIIAETADAFTISSTHWTTFKTFFGFAGVGGDPKATNLRGEKFEILAMGTFSLLSITDRSLESRLTLDATIDRAGEMCGATYIKNISVAGSWMQETANLMNVQVRATPGVPKTKSLQVALNGNWYKPSEVRGQHDIIEQANNNNMRLNIKGVKIEAHIDSHRVRKNGVKTHEFANFLNVKVNGLQNVKENGVKLGGLLAYDDNNFATEAPSGCKSGKVAMLKQQMNEEGSWELHSSGVKFISHIVVN